MKKWIYILIILLLSVKCFGIIGISEFFSPKIYLAINIILLIYPFIIRPNGIYFKEMFCFKNISYTVLILLSVLIAMIPANIFWKQSYMSSLMCIHPNFWWLFYIALLKLQPRQKDIVTALKYYTYIYIAIWILENIIHIPITNATNIAIEMSGGTHALNRSLKAAGDFGIAISGGRYIYFYLYMLIQQYSQHFSKKIIIETFLLFIFCFLLQNRSTLFFATIVLIVQTFRIQSHYKWVLISGIGIMAILFITLTADHWIALFRETQSQLNDPDYNRIKALNYFLYDFSPDWKCYIFGNGHPNWAGSKYGMFVTNLGKMGIFDSDLGIFANYIYFGILPIIVFYIVIFSIIKRNAYPLFLKLIALHMLFVPTIWGILIWPYMIIPTVLVFYMFIYYQYYTPQNLYKKYEKNRNSNLEL